MGNKERFVRTAGLVGDAAVRKLNRSSVAVFGVGGVGGYVVEALVRSGVGRVDIYDNDTVAESNINRQIIATSSTVGQNKVDVMKKRALDINPDVTVNAYKMFFMPDNSDDIDFSRYDYVVDAIDTVTAKIEIIVKAKENNVPVISAMGAGNKLHPEMFEIADIYKTSVCPLAKVMRRELKARKIKKLKVVYSKELPVVKERVPASIAFVPGVAGMIIAGEVVRDLVCNNDKYRVRNVYDKASDKVLNIEVPGSKSITNRALLLAVLANGESTLNGVLFSDDSRHFMECVKELGFETDIDEENKRVRVKGLAGELPVKEGKIYVGSAGTCARFLTAYLGLSKGTYYLDSSEQMKKRPMAPLLKTLSCMGTKVEFKEREGYFPYVLSSDGVTSTDIEVDINVSSQFLSAMLISACATNETINICVTGEHGMAYIDMTIAMMKQFGVDVKKKDNVYTIDKGSCYNSLNYMIEPDVSAASYFYAAAAILGATVTVKGVHFDSLQGDIQFIRYLESMGCIVTDNENGITLSGPKGGRIKGIEADMHACSDQAITMAAISPFADSPVTITGIGHIKYQECDRMNAIVTELTRMGIKCDCTDDSITIYPGNPSPCTVNTYDDHRMAMGFSLVGLRAEGIVIDNPGCSGKTFENYFEVLDEMIYNQILL